MNYTLRSCVWELTLACSFSCKYCGSSGGKARENELTTLECIHIANQLADLGCRRVSMIGGEVFMKKDWELIVETLVSHKIKVCIITNGYILTPSHIERLKSLHIESIAVSIDGTEAIHDKYRQPGSFAKARNVIEQLVQNKIPVSVISTLNKENVETLETLYQNLKDSGIFAWQLQACSPMGNAAQSGIDYRFDPQKVIDFVSSHMRTAPFMLGIADNIGYYSEEEGYLRGNLSGKAVFHGCRAGLTSIGIDSIGNVRGCESMYDSYFIEGNLREKTLREIWENPDGFAYNRKFTPELLTGACRTCDKGMYCAGGCRSYAYFVHQKLHEAPFCVRAKANSDSAIK